MLYQKGGSTSLTTDVQLLSEIQDHLTDHLSSKAGKVWSETVVAVKIIETLMLSLLKMLRGLYMKSDCQQYKLERPVTL